MRGASDKDPWKVKAGDKLGSGVRRPHDCPTCQCPEVEWEATVVKVNADGSFLYQARRWDAPRLP